MRSGAIAFFFGVLLLQQLPELPDGSLLQFLPLTLLLALATRGHLRMLWFLACGLLWACFRAELILVHALPASLEGHDLVIQGAVASIPVRDALKTRFEFDVEGPKPLEDEWRFPGRVRLNWYGKPPDLTPGARWRLTVRLKRPHGFMNPGGFDYEGWLYRQRISATGYVRAQGEKEQLSTGPDYLVARLRFRLATAIDRALGEDRPFAGIAKALTLGIRDGITETQWETLRATGTSHLMAISGLHIGLVAGIAFFLGRRLWSLAGRTVLLMPAPQVGAIAAMAAALGYAGLAGFSVPTQRALVMVWVIMGGLLLRRQIPVSHSLAAALLVVVLLDPFAVLSPGFWLSFLAVAVILFGVSSRLASNGIWRKWGRVQWLIAVGLVPLTLAFFHQHPVIAPVANTVAVPWIGLLVVPLLLLGIVVLAPLETLGGWFLSVGTEGIALLWPLLDRLSGLDLMYMATREPPLWAVLVGLTGVALILLPQGVPGRWLGIIWLGPLFLLPPLRPGDGSLWFTLLDAGQGLAAVVRTHRHVLVYDTGPRFSPTFDAGRAVLVPFLRHSGIGSVDVLVLSHGDTDHVGGVKSLLKAVTVRRVVGYANDEVARAVSHAQACRAGQRWSWDGYDFQILHPASEVHGDDNDHSCVLRISGPGGAVLLTGDIERRTESLLVRTHADQFPADILVVPHHGSRSSTTPAFLEATRPRYALLSVGYRNRFGFPHPEVLKRLKLRGVKVYESGRDGAITFTLTRRQGLSGPRLHREVVRHFWNHRSYSRRRKAR